MSRKPAGKARAGPGARRGRRPRQPLASPAPDTGSGGGGLARQLRALGLKLREVPGDGNCLFRALGDQLEGHSRNHLRHRQETVDFMIKQREDFEPFVEDDVPFEKHVTNLAKPGTFAGNDAIVAFARNNQLNVVIHQLNAPLWQMLCKNDLKKEEEVKTQKGDSEEKNEVEVEDAIQKVCNATGCSDIDLVSRILEVEDYNIESATFAILQVKEVEKITLLLVGAEEQCDPQSQDQKWYKKTLREENGTGSRIFGSGSLRQDKIEPKKGQTRSDGENQASRSQKVCNKQKKEQQRLEKKKRQEGRHRQKVLANKSDCAESSRAGTDSTNQVTLVKAVAALNI
ncbi:OTU domain-containing protein 3 isoform X4 [Apus apus]|uniref:OTU domain-containing protein 3 isoform X4 n=1 Tax=Apus apus TaxID=8895 RepID=UPI0021F8E1D7|nr:OTU domain-containing protein 3 isoform X4 [Apus apus]